MTRTRWPRRVAILSAITAPLNPAPTTSQSYMQLNRSARIAWVKQRKLSGVADLRILRKAADDEGIPLIIGRGRLGAAEKCPTAAPWAFGGFKRDDAHKGGRGLVRKIAPTRLCAPAAWRLLDRRGTDPGSLDGATFRRPYSGSLRPKKSEASI